jgi:hypothetical protein
MMKYSGMRGIHNANAVRAPFGTVKAESVREVVGRKCLSKQGRSEVITIPSQDE